MPSALGKEKQDREQQLQSLLKLLLKMTRHFTGKVTTIWALGAGDEVESWGGQALVTSPSRPDSEKSRMGDLLGQRKGGQSPSSGQSPLTNDSSRPSPTGKSCLLPSWGTDDMKPSSRVWYFFCGYSLCVPMIIVVAV